MIACNIVTWYKTVVVRICIDSMLFIVGLCNGSAIVMLMKLTINYERECGRPSKAWTTSTIIKQHSMHSMQSHSTAHRCWDNNGKILLDT